MIAKINFKSPLTLSILAGILLGTSTIPFPPWALFFCLSPLFYIWLNETPKKVFTYTTLTFFIGSAISFFWIAYLFNQFARLPLPINALLSLLYFIFYHFHIAVIGFIFAKWIRPFTKSPTIAASSIFAISWLIFPMLFPWNFSLGWYYAGLQGYQFADIIGAEGIGSLTILLNGALLFSFLSFKKTKLPLSLSVLFLIAFNFAGSIHVRRLTKPDQNLNVVIGQANIGNLEDHYKADPYGYKFTVIDQYLSATQLGYRKAGDKKVDLVVWPETAFPEYYTKNFFKSLAGQKLTDFTKKNNVNLMTGLFTEAPNKKTANAILAVNQNGTTIGAPVYKKILLAFGEYLPGESLIPALRKWLPMVGDFERGESPQVRQINNAKLGIQICYEGLFPAFTRKLVSKGSQIMVNFTNDSWYGKYSEPQQHLYLSAFRAIEQRQSWIRATNTGISTIVLADGTFLERSPIHKAWGGFYEVPYASKPSKTVYQRYGFAIPLPLLLILFIISLIYGKQRP